MDVDPCSDIVYCIVINIPSSGYSSCSGNGIARNNTDVLKVFSFVFSSCIERYSRCLQVLLVLPSNSRKTINDQERMV
uniref:Uncharacterized protein n=1 Tax=Anguilla anguilla TaxID=7936 RepID=A0A0E9R0X5_ANGAN